MSVIKTARVHMNVNTKIQRHNVLLAVLVSQKYRDANDNTMTRFISTEELKQIFYSLNMQHLFYRYSVYLYDICKNETKNDIERKTMIEKQYIDKKVIAFRMRFANEFIIKTVVENNETVTFALRDSATMLRKSVETVNVVASQKKTSERKLVPAVKFNSDKFNEALRVAEAEARENEMRELCESLNIDYDYEMSLLDANNFDVATQRALAA